MKFATLLCSHPERNSIENKGKYNIWSIKGRCDRHEWKKQEEHAWEILEKFFQVYFMYFLLQSPMSNSLTFTASLPFPLCLPFMIPCHLKEQISNNKSVTNVIVIKTQVSVLGIMYWLFDPFCRIFSFPFFLESHLACMEKGRFFRKYHMTTSLLNLAYVHVCRFMCFISPKEGLGKFVSFPSMMKEKFITKHKPLSRPTIICGHAGLYLVVEFSFWMLTRNNVVHISCTIACDLKISAILLRNRVYWLS